MLALSDVSGRLPLDKFSHYETLSRVCGEDDPLNAYLMFEREMNRFIATGNKIQAAAALFITAPQDAVLARFEEVLAHFDEPEGPDRNGRTARRWSNRG